MKVSSSFRTEVRSNRRRVAGRSSRIEGRPQLKLTMAVQAASDLRSRRQGASIVFALLGGSCDGRLFDRLWSVTQPLMKDVKRA